MPQRRPRSTAGAGGARTRARTILVTGGAGLVGTECIRHFANLGDKVISIDNYMRGTFFGEEGNTKSNIDRTTENFPNITHIEGDIRDKELLTKTLPNVDAIIHTAAQPSHPKSIEIPIEDFWVNAWGTLQLLETARQLCPDAVFVHCSTNKVYGDAPNELPYKELPTRYDFRDIDSIDESLPLDQSMHTPFGVSKVAADLYAQEYARLYGLKTGVFRMGCITGGVAKAVEQHNWEPYFVRANVEGIPLTIYGYQGKQVRDVIHARDLARLFEHFIQKPHPGEVYNIGGGRQNSTSLLEALERIEGLTGKKTRYSHGPEREGDHRVYISDLGKVQHHYPGWKLQFNLDDIFKEIYEYMYG